MQPVLLKASKTTIQAISFLLLQEQEVIVGHLASPCNAIWRSVCALHNMNQLLVDMTAAGLSSVNLETASIRYPCLLYLVTSCYPRLRPRG